MTSTHLEAAIFGSSARFRFLLWIAERQRDEFFVSQYWSETGKKWAGAKRCVSVLRDAGYLHRIEPPSHPMLDDQGQPITLPDGTPLRRWEHAGADWSKRDHQTAFWLSLNLFAEEWGITTLIGGTPPRPPASGRDASAVIARLAELEAGLRG